MGRLTHKFELADRDGELHAYQCTEHPTDEGFDLQLELAEILAGVPSVILAGLEAMDAMGAEEEAALADKAPPPPYDPANLGNALAVIPRSIAKAGGHRLVVKILAHTKRQAQASGAFQDLSSQLQRDEAYAGNYKELYQAIWEIITANFDPFSMVNTDALKQAWEQLQTWLPEEGSEEPQSEST